MTTIQDRFRLRRGTAANLAAVNEVPLADEIVIESDTGLSNGARKMKIGDGVTPWNSLPYLAMGGVGQAGVVNPPGSAYTFAVTDDNKTIVSGSATAFALTIPTDASVALPVGARVAYTQGAAGQVTVTGSVGVTVHAPNGNTTGALFDGGVAEKIGANEWQLWNGPALAAVAKSGDYNDLINKPNQLIVNERTASYTLGSPDAFQAVRLTSATAVALTIPTNATAAIPLGVAIPILQGGTGYVSILAASGVTLEAPNGSGTTGLGDFRVVFQRSANIWVIA